MTRFLRYLSPVPRSFIDTLDVQSDKSEKVTSFGVTDNVSISAAEERAMLQRGSALLAIHRGDAAKLGNLVPELPVLTVGVDFAAPDVGPPPEQPTILVVGHNNVMNVKGVQDFLRFAWPSIRAARPDARFVVVGKVAQSIRYPDPRVHLAGWSRTWRPIPTCARRDQSIGRRHGIEDQDGGKYRLLPPDCDVPARRGRYRQPLLGMCHVVSDWYEFAEKVIALLDPAQSTPERPNRRNHQEYS